MHCIYSMLSTAHGHHCSVCPGYITVSLITTRLAVDRHRQLEARRSRGKYTLCLLAVPCIYVHSRRWPSRFVVLTFQRSVIVTDGQPRVAAFGSAKMTCICGLGREMTVGGGSLAWNFPEIPHGNPPNIAVLFTWVAVWMVKDEAYWRSVKAVGRSAEIASLHGWLV